MKSRKRDSQADDLPDITVELMDELNEMWRIDEMLDDLPIEVLIKAVQTHFDAINPYFDAIKDAKVNWYTGWGKLRDLVEELDVASKDIDNTTFRSVPDQLRLQEVNARMNLDKDNSDWKILQDQYHDEFERRREELVDLEQRIATIKVATDIDVLKSLDYVKERPVVRAANSCINFFSSFFYVTEVPVEVESELLEVKRERLLKFYQELKASREISLNEFGDQAPKKPDRYRSEWNLIRAKIFYHQIYFNRRQSQAVMLQCMRLYVLAFRIYYMIYGESPLANTRAQQAVAKIKIAPITDEADECAMKTIAKIKPLFRQLFLGMDSLMKTFYCMRPDRFEFSDYLDKFNHIQSSAIRDAILAGDKSEVTLQYLFGDDEIAPLPMNGPK